MYMPTISRELARGMACNQLQLTRCPLQLHGIEEAIKCAQNGGVGLVVYFQKEGRALGEVTKYLVRAGHKFETYWR